MYNHAELKVVIENMNRLPALPFDKAAMTVDEKTAFKRHFLTLKDTLRDLTKQQPDLNQIEPELRTAFKKFLGDMGYHLALGNFEILLQEKSNGKKYRNDGTINWYHEFIPILTLLTLASQGKNDGGFNIKDLESYGGLETLICTHLRHDSKEDFKKLDEIWDEQMGILGSLQNNPKYAGENGRALVEGIVSNIDLISQKRIDENDPNSPKEDIRDYTRRMARHENSSPIIYMCKQADIIHNLATIYGSPKFTPEKKQRICDIREDMFGSRYGFTEVAMKRWPNFKPAFATLDSMMGFVLFPHFRYLENVDLHYKSPSPDPVGISKYIARSVRPSIPELFNPIHISIKRMASSVSVQGDPEKNKRLQDFMQDGIRGALEDHSKFFPYLFGSNDNKRTNISKPVAAP